MGSLVVDQIIGGLKREINGYFSRVKIEERVRRTYYKGDKTTCTEDLPPQIKYVW